jgi:radical SAM superfamily enzyme YgiQ (UPF0313 family)
MVNKKNCLLIVHDVYQEYNFFPLGAGYLAAVLEKNHYSVEVYCMDVFHYTNEQLTEKLDESEYDIIGCGFMAARYTETIVDLCKVVNAHKKNAWFVLGGFGPSPISEFIVEDTGCDIVAMGEGEETIVELMKQKLSDTPALASVLGITYRDGDNIKKNERRPLPKDLDSFPFPAWHLFPMEKYLKSARRKHVEDDDNVCSVLTSRGCVARCSFCYRLEKGMRIRSLDNVVEEFLELQRRYGVTVFRMEDELCFCSKKRILDFEKKLTENNLKVKLIGQVRADIFDEEVVKSLKRTGLIFANVGFESSSQEVLKYINKNVTIEQNINTLELCKQEDIPVGLNFVCNFPPETKKDIMGNVKLMLKYTNYSNIRTIRPVTPYPGSPMYYEALQKGLLKGPKDFFDKFRNSDLIHTNFTRYTNDELFEILLEANSILIKDYFENTNGDMDAADELIDQFRSLYTGKNEKFRGTKVHAKERLEKVLKV